jgi:hypothetical protein
LRLGAPDILKALEATAGSAVGAPIKLIEAKPLKSRTIENSVDRQALITIPFIEQSFTFLKSRSL